MKIVKTTPQKALSKAFLKQRVLRCELDLFKSNLIVLLDKISVIENQPKDESEEHLKNNLRDFLRDTYYKETNAINTKDKKDLVIHLDKTTNSEVGVIIEAKRPANVNEMFSAETPNKKALHELILYYLNERNNVSNSQLKHLIITNINEWYIIDANYFDKHIYRNTQIQKLYETKLNDKKDNPFFYEEIAKIIDKLDIEIPCIYFNIKEYDKILRDTNKENDKTLNALQKILSPFFLLKTPFANDSNSLNEKFYKELLHIIGLEEAKDGSRNIIRRKKENRNPASLIETTIEALITEDPLHHLPDQSIYGITKEERLFNVSLELCITWINRILFLKLLEGQLESYHQGNKEYCFLNTKTIHDFDELFKLFHKVLAVNLNDRTDAVKSKYNKIPYLNSSLFEISELEDQTIKLNSLDNQGQLELINTTILKELKKTTSKLPTLEYLFKFLEAYDFASESNSEIQEENKTIINASVLGKVFEKINGYKDGSIFTPGFITMYMCRKSARLAVVQKFKDIYGWNIETIEDLKNYLADRKSCKDILEFNAVINSLKLCDPAVGSGHFLVSMLNEIISIKYDLGLLADYQGNRITDYEITIDHDELILTDYKGSIFEYKIINSKPKSAEVQRIQKTLFHEKQAIIENCLFGVDINPNSVKICRLRLWIELLKNAYYKEETNYLELETLPNIDINIKCGNSLLSRFALDSDLTNALKSIKYDIKAYRGFVSDYKNEKNRDLKRGLQKIIDSIKGDFRTQISNNDPKVKKLIKLQSEYNLLVAPNIFNDNTVAEAAAMYGTPENIKKAKERKEKLELEINSLSKEIEDIKANAIYKNAFEWRFEFPEVLNNDGVFEGFDIIVGNPPYIEHKKLSHISHILKERYKVYYSSADISSYFFELGIDILSKKGVLSYINTNKFFRTEYGKPLRKFISELKIHSIINFEQVPIFDEALVSSLIIILEKDKEKLDFPFCEFSKEPSPSKHFEAETLKRIINISQNSISETSWAFSNNSISSLIEKLYQNTKRIKDIATIDIKRGVTTGFDPAFIITNKIATQISNKEIIKPLLKGAHIKKYQTISSGLNLIFTRRGYNIESDKKIKKHLQFFQEDLKPKNENEKRGRKPGDYMWFEIQDNIAYYKNFDKEKIVWPLTADKWGFALDKEKHYLSSGGFILISKDLTLNYLLAILNSNLMKFLFSQIGVMTAGGAFTLKKATIDEFPIKEISLKDQKPFISLVDKIIKAKQADKDSTELEKQIDDLVYRLYEITTEEQQIIEGL